MKNTHLENKEELIGQYLNRVLWSDVDPIGKIVGFRGKFIALVQRVEAGENLTKMEFYAGGFSAHCPNNWSQRYEYRETEEVFEVSLSKSSMKKNFIQIGPNPRKHYDYNF
jgi:hypothetical protein